MRRSFRAAELVTILQALEGWLCLQYVQVGPECPADRADVVERA